MRGIKSLVLIGLIVVLVSTGCVLPKGGDEGKRDSGSIPPYFVETKVSANTGIVNPYPLEYGIIIGEETTITFTASKHIDNLNGTMIMRIDLPEGLELTGGDREWRGNDVAKTIEIKVKGIKKGKWLLNATALNEENNKSRRNHAIIYVANTIGEMRGMGFGKEVKGQSGGIKLGPAVKIINQSEINVSGGGD